MVIFLFFYYICTGRESFLSPTQYYIENCKNENKIVRKIDKFFILKFFTIQKNQLWSWFFVDYVEIKRPPFT